MSFGRAMRRVLRQDPDVILVGEMRDEETVRTALSAAETGHLVLSTVHTLDATETVNRIIDFFPPHLQQQARVMLAATLRGAIAQRLVPDLSGEGRVPASEVMVVTGRIQDLILNPEETGKITEVIAEGEYYGMRTFDQSLLGYVMEGRISEEVAMENASSAHDLKLMLAAGGQRASGIEQMEERQNGAARRCRGEGGAEQQPDRPGRRWCWSWSPSRPSCSSKSGGGERKKRRAGSEHRRRRDRTDPAGKSASAAGEVVEGAVEAAIESGAAGGAAASGAMPTSVPAPPPPHEFTAAYDSGKTVVLLVIHDGGIDDRLTALSATA